MGGFRPDSDSLLLHCSSVVASVSAPPSDVVVVEGLLLLEQVRGRRVRVPPRALSEGCREEHSEAPTHERAGVEGAGHSAESRMDSLHDTSAR